MTHEEHEAERRRIANDESLVELARNYKPDAETLAEMAKYETTIPTAELLFMVLR